MATRTLAVELRARSDAELRQLLAERPDLATPTPGDLTVLAARTGVRVSVLRALERLDRSQLAVLDALVLVDEPTRAAAERLLHADPGPALDRLRLLALVWGDDAALSVHPTVREVLDRPAALGRPMAALLDRYSADSLTRIVDAAGHPVTTGTGPGARDAVISALAARVADAEAVRADLAQLPDDEQAVLRQLAGDSPLGSVARALPVRPLPDAEGPVRTLISRGWLVAIDGDTVELPREVGMALRGDRPLGPGVQAAPPLDGATPGPGTIAGTAGRQAAETLRLTETALELWSASPPSVLRSGGLGVRELRTLARSLDADEPTTSLVLEVAYAAGLLDRSGEVADQWVPTTAYDSWLALDPPVRWVRLAQAWLTTPRLPSLAGQRDDRDKPMATLGFDLQRPGAPALRREVLDVLAEAPAGTAPTEEAVLGRLAWRAPLRGGRGRDTWTRWVLAEAAALGVTGRGALPEASLALLADDADKAARAVARLLPEPGATLLLQNDLTAIAPGPLVPEVAREVALLADVESAGAGTVYRLSESSVRRALDAGRTAADVQAFLARVSTTGVPQTVSYLVEDVSRRHGVLRVGNASSYVRCDDAALVAEVVAARKLASAGLRALAPTVLVSPLPVGQLLEALRAAGYAPVAEGIDGAVVLSRSVVARTAGRMRSPRTDPYALTPEQTARVVAHLREADRRAASGPQVPDRSAAATVAVLQEAARSRRRVWIDYLAQEGSGGERVVLPLRVDGGYLTAHDEASGATRSFALHRISAVSNAR